MNGCNPNIVRLKPNTYAVTKKTVDSCNPNIVRLKLGCKNGLSACAKVVILT